MHFIKYKIVEYQTFCLMMKEHRSVNRAFSLR